MREQCRGEEGGDGPPELPPRPPHLLPLSPRPPAPHAPAYSPPTPGDPHHCTVSSPSTSPWYSPLTQKYVLLTLICGGLSVVLGALFMAIYLTVKSTATSYPEVVEDSICSTSRLEEYIRKTGQSLGWVSDHVVEHFHQITDQRFSNSHYHIKDLKSDLHGLKMLQGTLHLNAYQV